MSVLDDIIRARYAELEDEQKKLIQLPQCDERAECLRHIDFQLCYIKMVFNAVY